MPRQASTSACTANAVSSHMMNRRGDTALSTRSCMIRTSAVGSVGSTARTAPRRLAASASGAIAVRITRSADPAGPFRVIGR